MASKTITINFSGDVKGLDKATEGAKRSVEKVSGAMGNAAGPAKDYSDKVGAVGEKVDASEQKILGVKDTIDGVTTVMQGPGKVGLAAYIQGWADLASGFANAVIPAIKNTVPFLKVLNGVLRANPIGIVITVLALLVGAFILAYKKSETFRNIVNAVWDAVKKAGQVFLDWVKGIPDWFKRMVDKVKEWVGTLVDVFKKLHKRISDAASGMWDGIKNAFRGAVNWIIDKWNNFKLSIGGQKVNLPFGLSFDIPKITLNTPNIPRLALGGFAQAGRTYLVGERGPELFTPETSGTVTPNNQLGSNIEVRVFIGDQELRGIVKTEIKESNRSLKRSVLAGAVA